MAYTLYKFNFPSCSVTNNTICKTRLKLLDLLLRVAHLLGEPEEGAHGVGAGAQHEDEGGDLGHVLVQLLQPHRGGLHVLLAQVLLHEVADRKHRL